MRISDWSSDVCSSDLVKWTESIYERGSLARTERWTAMLTVVMKPPKTTDSLRKNPLGLYVNAIDWARELEGAPTTRSADETQPPAPTNLPQPMIAPGSIDTLPALPAPANSATPDAPPNSAESRVGKKGVSKG